jgi:hypothetical protein
MTSEEACAGTWLVGWVANQYRKKAHEPNNGQGREHWRLLRADYIEWKNKPAIPGGSTREERQERQDDGIGCL